MELIAFSITFTVLFSLMFLIVGGLVGWVAKDYFRKQSIHPEMFDESGRLIPDEVIAFSFENPEYLDYEEDE